MLVVIEVVVDVVVVIVIAVVVFLVVVLRVVVLATIVLHFYFDTKDTFSVVDGGICERGHCDPPSWLLVATLRSRGFNVQTLPKTLNKSVWRQSSLAVHRFEFLRLRMHHYFGN